MCETRLWVCWATTSFSARKTGGFSVLSYYRRKNIMNKVVIYFINILNFECELVKVYLWIAPFLKWWLMHNVVELSGWIQPLASFISNWFCICTKLVVMSNKQLSEHWKLKEKKSLDAHVPQEIKFVMSWISWQIISRLLLQNLVNMNCFLRWFNKLPHTTLMEPVSGCLIRKTCMSSPFEVYLKEQNKHF